METQPQPAASTPPRRRWLAWTVAVAVFLAAVAAAFFIGRGSADRLPTTTTPTAKAARYHCPMHPTYVSDRPGDCPICAMALVPIEQGGEHAGHDTTSTAPNVPGRVPIFLAPQRQQKIGLTTAPVEKRKLANTIRAVGRVAYAEPKLAWVNAKFTGWIEKLHVDKTGQVVRKGEPLLDIYSPDLVAAQEEYLIALQTRQKLSARSDADAVKGAENVLAGARRRLQLWDISDDQIAELEKAGQSKKSLTLVSPVAGHVIEKTALAGKNVMAGENLFRVADLSVVWLYASIYESESPLLQEGQDAIVTLNSLPGEKFHAKITSIYPYVEEQTRSVTVRLETPNPDGKLKPDMWATVEIAVEPGDLLAAPASAIIDTGKRHVAFVDKGEGHLEPRELKIGLKTDDYYQVLEGLSEGERVVTRALFLVDSESQLKAAISGMGAAGRIE